MAESQTQRTGLNTRVLSALQGNSIAAAVVLVVLFMFIPLPKFAIDIAMVMNLAVAFIILLSVVYLRRAADFSSFPQVVLLITLFGLAINVSSTRNILIHPVVGSGGRLNMAGQSEMVQTFANIVAGDSVVIGFIIFVILIVVQMLVVTKGADRVSEVSARFTLDAMNNKMFDIQNDLNAGLITEDEARARKARLNQEISFYSAMDGSSKFVSGNVKAGIFITVVNLVGGIVTGMMAGLGPMDALNAYAKLTIGDGLMSQLPALMISFATGLLVTGTSTGDMLSEQIKKNFTNDGSVYIITGATLVVLAAAFHNSASVVLLPVGAGFIYFGIMERRAMNKSERAKKEAETAEKNAPKKAAQEEVSPLILTDALSLYLGYALVPLVDSGKGAELLERVKKLRREIGLDLGLVVPPIRIRDSIKLEPEVYSFQIRGVEAGSSRLKLGYYMCLNTGNVPKDREIPGESTVDPTFGIPAIWLPESKRVEAENAGYAVIDAPTIIATHLTNIIRNHAAEILSRQDVHAMIDKLKETNSVVVDEVMGGQNPFTYGEIEAVLKNLLSEQVSICNLVVIMETISDYGKYTKDSWILTEKVREALGKQIVMQYVDDTKKLHVINTTQAFAQKLIDHKREVAGKRPFVAFDPVDWRKMISAVSTEITAVRERNFLPVILCHDDARVLMKSLLERDMPGVVVLSNSEVMAAGPEVRVEAIGEINAI